MKIKVVFFLQKTTLLFLFASLLLVSASCKEEQAERRGAVHALYITWEGNPSTTATICWFEKSEASPNVLVRAQGTTEWLPFKAHGQQLPYSTMHYYQAQLKKLKPETTYEFRINSYQRTYHFTTMPAALTSELKFIVGGDLSVSSTTRTMNRIAGERKPDFVVWGGDLAYEDGNLEKSDLFVEFWRDWYNQSTIQNRIIPVISAIGNHEVVKHYGGTVENAPFFYMFFPHEGNSGYRVVDFGNYLSILLLDTDHTNPIAGRQTRWLENTLRERKTKPHLIPVYHVPAFPSHRFYNTSQSVSVRENWLPLFDEYQIPIAFEHHDHTFKRTVPIKNEQENPSGTVYLGDGAWGVPVRNVFNPATTWYLEKASSTHHFFEVTLTPTNIDVKAINAQNSIFDEVSRPARIK